VTGFPLLALVDGRDAELWDAVVFLLPQTIALTCLDALPPPADCPRGPYALLATGSAAPVVCREVAALPVPTRLVLVDPDPPTGRPGTVPAISVLGTATAIASLLAWKPYTTTEFEVRLRQDRSAASQLTRDHVVDSLRLWWS